MPVTGERIEPDRYDRVRVAGNAEVYAGFFVFPPWIRDDTVSEAVAGIGGNVGVGAGTWTREGRQHAANAPL